MRDYKQEYSALVESIDNDILNTFLVIEKKIGSEPLMMGFDNVTNAPIILKNMNVIKISLNLALNGFYTKCNHIGFNKFETKRSNMFIKGFQLYNHRYRLKTIHYLSVNEKILILKHLEEKYKEELK